MGEIMIKFPEELPLGLVSDNTQQDTSYSTSTKFASGMSRVRKQFNSTVTNTKFSFILTNEQCLIFKDWFDNKINSGADWFLMKRKTVRGIEEFPTRITGMYSGFNPISLSGRWSLEFNAEMNIKRPDDDLWQFPCILDEACLLDEIVNEIWVKA